MGDNNITQHSENISNHAISIINDEVKEMLKILVKSFSEKIKDKIPELSDKIEKKIKEMANKPDILDEMAVEWSKELFNKGLVSEGYSGLSDNLLIANFHQDGYLSGLYAGYVLAMMSLVDNKAEEKLILSVRDNLRPNLIGHHYNDRDEFYKRYQNETYRWVETIERKIDK